jgi:tRNA nucleotidyltransferase (CCA-adding enzyme)
VTAPAAPHWEHFPHGADIGIRGTGPSFAAALEQVALALTAVVTPPERVAVRETVEVACDAPGPDELLYDWIDTIVYEMATRGMVFGAFEVDVSETHLAGRLGGESVDRERHEPAIEVKGPTYTQLLVSHDADGRWLAQCVVDV